MEILFGNKNTLFPIIAALLAVLMIQFSLLL